MQETASTTETSSEAPVVVILRHPDAGNDFQSFGGEVQILDIDLGSGFDGHPRDEEEAREWAEGVLEHLAELGLSDEHPARAHVRWIVEETLSEGGFELDEILAGIER